MSVFSRALVWVCVLLAAFSPARLALHHLAHHSSRCAQESSGESGWNRTVRKLSPAATIKQLLATRILGQSTRRRRVAPSLRMNLAVVFGPLPGRISGLPAIRSYGPVVEVPLDIFPFVTIELISRNHRIFADRLSLVELFLSSGSKSSPIVVQLFRTDRYGSLCVVSHVLELVAHLRLSNFW